MDTELFRAFQEVARQRSISGAARRLAYSQSAVSRQIATLESDLGVALFDRQARGVGLTEHGRCLLEHAEALLMRLELARRELDSINRLEGGRLRVGAFTTATACLIPRAMAAFATRWPGVSLSLIEGITPRLLDRLESDDVEIAVVSAFSGQRLDRERFDFTRLLEDAMFVALPCTHRLARRRRPLRVAELEGEPWIGADMSAEDSILGPARLAQAIASDFPVREWTAKLGLVAAGLGITLIPSLAADAARSDVAVVKIDGADAPPRSVYAATLRRRTPSPAITAFIEVLQHTAKRIAN